MRSNRRTFIKSLGMATAGAGLASSLSWDAMASAAKPAYDISLAQFSLASEFFAGKHDILTFPERARKEYGIAIVEYVSMFFAGKEGDAAFIKELKKRSDDAGVKNNLIMVDGENLADPDTAKRTHAVESHYKWVDIAKVLGCNSIRVNLGGMNDTGTPEEIAKLAIDGYSRLLEYGDKNKLDIIVENHIGISCNGKWLAGVMKEVNHKRAGVLPDFGNFCVKRTPPATQDIAGWMATTCVEEYDKYQGVAELMPYAKGVSAKTHKFDSNGNEPDIDFVKMFDIIRKSGFKGVVGIEYEGGLMQAYGQPGYVTNEEGIKATKKLLEKVM